MSTSRLVLITLMACVFLMGAGTKSFVGCSCGGEEPLEPTQFCKADAGCPPCIIWVCKPGSLDGGVPACKQVDGGMPCNPNFGTISGS